MFTMNYPSLSVLKCIRHFLRSLFWFSRIMPWLYPDIDMAASAGTSAEKHGCAKAVVVDCLFAYQLHQTQNKFLCFHFRFLICPAEPHSMNVLE